MLYDIPAAAAAGLKSEAEIGKLAIIPATILNINYIRLRIQTLIPLSYLFNN